MKKPARLFIGNVYLAPVYSQAMKEELSQGKSKLSDMTDAFKVYWQTGFHPDLGQDTAFLKPKEIQEMAIRKSHVRQSFYSNDHGYSSTEEAWNRWSLGRSIAKPASNSYIIYSVTDARDAIISGFLPDRAHKICADQSEYLNGVIDFTYTLFSKNRFRPMPISEQIFLFDDKWLQMPTNDD